MELNVQQMHSWLGNWIRQRLNIFHSLLVEQEKEVAAFDKNCMVGNYPPNPELN
jgi:hypothetical protein